MKTRLTNLVVGLLLSVFAARLIHAADTVPVTVDNFIRAESDLYFGGILKDSGGAMGKFNHGREPLGNSLIRSQ
jgi:hypothetical protein